MMKGRSDETLGTHCLRIGYAMGTEAPKINISKTTEEQDISTLGYRWVQIIPTKDSSMRTRKATHTHEHINSVKECEVRVSRIRSHVNNREKRVPSRTQSVITPGQSRCKGRSVLYPRSVPKTTEW